MSLPPVIFSPADLRDLRLAKSLLENPSFTVRLSNLIGAPIETAITLLPERVHGKINQLTKAALFRSLEVAIATTRKHAKSSPSTRFHKILAGASGGIGGAFGLAALAIELPVSTTIILRSIVEIARGEGHDPAALETKLDCLEVFALDGARSAKPSETAYWVTRLALRESLADAASHLAGKSVLDKTSPTIVRFVGAVAARYGVLISEETAAKALPILEAVGGSVINVIFMDHFQHMARGHFIIRRLEKRFGAAEVQRRYEEL